MSRELIDLVKDKLSKDDLVDIIVEQQEEVADLKVANQSWKDEQAKNREVISDLENDRSNAWAKAKHKQERIAQLFGRLERLARMFNSDISDDAMLSEMEQVLLDEFEIVDGKFKINR